MKDIELKKMIENFDFYTFLNPPKSQNIFLGGWIIITDSQYAMGYNDYDGKGYHGDSIRRALCEILEEDHFSSHVTPSFVKKNYIIGTMMSSADSMYILFDLKELESITSNQYQLFEKFKKEYNDIIQKRSEELKTNAVIFENEGMEFISNNLDLLSITLNKKIDESKVIPKDVHIIGDTLENNLSEKEIIEREDYQVTLYEYLKSNHRPMKGVAVITDKQSIFYGSLKENDLRTCYGISKDIEKKIHKEKIVEVLDNHSYLHLIDNKAILNLPNNGSITQTQIGEIMNFMLEIQQYNQEVENYQKIMIQINPWHGFYENSYDIRNVINLLQHINNYLVSETDEDEIIIEKDFNKTL